MSALKNALRNLRILFLRARSRQCNPLVLPQNALIIAPHPDDEVFGCGGLIAGLVKEKRPPHVVFLTGGEHSHNGCCDASADEITVARRRLTGYAMNILNLPAEKIHHLNFHDGQISSDDLEIRNLYRLIDSLRPDAVFVPHHGEGWSDHVNTGKIVKNLIAGNGHVSLYEYCVWFWYYNSRGIDWKRARLLKLNAREHKLKLKAIDTYITPLAPCGKPWSGVLPQILIEAHTWDKELYFKIR